MDTAVKSMLDAYVNAFDSFPCSNEKVNREIEEFKQAITRLAQSSGDLTTFMADYDAKGYGKQYINLFGKIAQANAGELTVEEIEQRQQITPREFVAQYNTAYDAIKACKYRKKAEQAYQNIYDLAEQYDDMLSFNVECEKRNLMFKLSADDSVEQLELIAEASDPLDKVIYPQYPRKIAVWRQSGSDADITYHLEKDKMETSQDAMRGQQLVMLVSTVLLNALEYIKHKHLVLTGESDRNIQTGLSGMALSRLRLKRLCKSVLPEFGLSIEEIFEDKFYRRLLLSPSNLDITGRLKQCSHPRNIEATREIIFEEMLTDTPIADLVFRPAKTPYVFGLKRRDGEVSKKYEKIAKEMNAELGYYKYVLAATSAPEFQQKSGFMKMASKLFKN